MSASSRYLSVWLRRLPTDRLRSTPDEPLVIVAPVKGALRLSAVNDAAAALGLRAGTALADARAMYPKIAVAEADERADFALLEAVADWCDRYTPLVGLDPPDGLTLDISGCAHLFGGEAALARDLARRLEAQGLQVRVAVAGTVGCAWGVARFAESLPLAGGGKEEVIAPGEECDTIASLPLAALRLAGATTDALAQVGLKHVADVLDRPRAPLAARFGAILVRRIDQALGREDEPITPRLPLPAALVEQRFPEPIAHERDVTGTIERLAARLARVLESRGEGARLLQVALYRADGKVFRIEAGTASPLREPARVARLFADRLDTIGDELDPGFGFDMVRLCALATERDEPRQTGLAAPDHEADLAHLIDRLGARFGLRRVTRQVMEDTHIPEFAVSAVSAHMVRARITTRSAHSRESGNPVLSSGFSFPGSGSPLSRGRAALQLAPQNEDSPFPTRPLRLFENPEPIEATAELPDGPPAQFTWRQMRHVVLHAEGPERIAMEWWRNRSGLVLMRDYFRIESREGLRVWIFRAWPKPKTQEGKKPESNPMEEWYLGQELDQQPIRWFLHGVFA